MTKRRWLAEIVVEFETDGPHADYEAQDRAKDLAGTVGGYTNRLQELPQPEPSHV